VKTGVAGRIRARAYLSLGSFKKGAGSAVPPRRIAPTEPLISLATGEIGSDEGVVPPMKGIGKSPDGRERNEGDWSCSSIRDGGGFIPPPSP